MIEQPVQTVTSQTDRAGRGASSAQAPQLSAERERQLAAGIKAGDPAAREELILANLPLVRNIASAFRGHNRVVDLNDLIQEGNLGLLRAASDFDPEAHGTRFVNYAACWIRYRIRRVLAEQTTTIRHPYYLVLLRRKFERTREQLIAASEANASAGEAAAPDFEAVAEHMGAEGRKLSLLRGIRGELHPRPIASISEPSHDAALARMTPPQEPLEIAESMERLHAAIRRLTLIESWLVRRRYRLDDPRAKPARGKARRSGEGRGGAVAGTDRWRTFRELSAEIGMPIHQLRAIERTALSKLQNFLEPRSADQRDRTRPVDHAAVPVRRSA